MAVTRSPLPNPHPTPGPLSDRDTNYSCFGFWVNDGNAMGVLPGSLARAKPNQLSITMPAPRARARVRARLAIAVS